MKFKGTILITDPCYLEKDNDDWDLTNGVIPPLTNYIISETGLGDVSGEVCGIENVLLGTYGVDSGMFGVFNYSEVLQYNPIWNRDIVPSCYTIIENFDGDIRLEFDEDNDSYYFSSLGNIPFYTTIK